MKTVKRGFGMLWEQGVVGSNPATPTKKRTYRFYR